VLAKIFTTEELMPVLHKCKYMTLSSIKNNVTKFKFLWRFGIMDSITMLRGCSNWPYVKKNIFSGQGSDFDKVFQFKMSKVGQGSNMDLMKQT
jgi:hypothetical protein